MAEIGEYDFSFGKVIDKVVSIKNPAKYIDDNLIHRMNERVFRDGMSEQEIQKKLYSLNTDKPGEVQEYMQELSTSNGHLTPGLALEIADLVYYSSMSIDINLKKWVEDLIVGTDVTEKIDMDMARRFCILKYNFRLREKKKDKKAEHEMMSDYLGQVQIKQ